LKNISLEVFTQINKKENRMSESTQAGRLFKSAEETGDISPDSLNILLPVAPAVKVSSVDNPHSELIYIAIEPDDSFSIKGANNIQPVIEGHNMVLDALKGSAQKGSILIRTQYLNGFVLNDWAPLDQAKRMDEYNYDPNLGTPLYDNTVLLLANMIAEIQRVKDSGKVARSGTLIVSDAADMSSVRCTAEDVRLVVEDMLAQGMHIISFMGISDGETDFHKVAKSMGIPSEWILTTANDPKSIRRAFKTFSDAMKQASQNAGKFDEVQSKGYQP
jgi:hypothetical protein